MYKSFTRPSIKRIRLGNQISINREGQDRICPFSVHACYIFGIKTQYWCKLWTENLKWPTEKKIKSRHQMPGANYGKHSTLYMQPGIKRTTRWLLDVHYHATTK